MLGGNKHCINKQKAVMIAVCGANRTFSFLNVTVLDALANFTLSFIKSHPLTSVLQIATVQTNLCSLHPDWW